METRADRRLTPKSFAMRTKLLAAACTLREISLAAISFIWCDSGFATQTIQSFANQSKSSIAFSNTIYHRARAGVATITMAMDKRPTVVRLMERASDVAGQF